MNRIVFDIQGLECAYVHRKNGDKKAVLFIGKLSIPMGKVTVLVGLSGSGKSTLIETLGLMNNTVTSGMISYYHNDEIIRINREIWNRPAELTRIRNLHFSFIFQNDFLMPYYSVEENMVIGRLIRGSSADVKAGGNGDLHALCQKMGLNIGELSWKQPSELSVGQRQRLSFIRAIVKDYSVVFGDEPTGNLDEVNSAMLMDVLNESIRLNSKRSAILVSHNIPLSVAKADHIVVLSRKNREMYQIRQDHVFSKTGNGWSGGGSDLLNGDVLIAKIREAVHFNQQM